jgi:DNA-nicking Smr family endonuclease
VQALGGGSPELRPLAAARAGRTATVAGDEPVPIPIEDALDLHAFAPRDIPSVVAEYLEAAHARGFTEVRLIHGRGIGVQRRIVHSVLTRHPRVAAFADAPPERGGPGATIVRLK